MRNKHHVSPTCSPPEGGATIFNSWTHPGQLRLRAHRTKMPPASPPLPRGEFATFSSPSLPGTGIALRLKIPGVATHESAQQELAPNLSGGSAARDDRNSLLRSGREHSAPLHGEIALGRHPQPRSG